MGCEPVCYNEIAGELGDLVGSLCAPIGVSDPKVVMGIQPCPRASRSGKISRNECLARRSGRSMTCRPHRDAVGAADASVLVYFPKGLHAAFGTFQNSIRDVTAVSGESAKTPSIPMQKNSRYSCVGCSP